MVKQPSHPLQAIVKGCRSLQGKPGIENHRPLLPAAIESVKSGLALGQGLGLQGRQPGTGQGHRGPIHRRAGRRNRSRLTSRHQPFPDLTAQQAIAATIGPGQIPLAAATVQGLVQGFSQHLAQTTPQALQGPIKGRWIRFSHALLQLRQGRQAHKSTSAGLREGGVRQYAAKCLQQLILQQGIRPSLGPPPQCSPHQLLPRIPAGKRVAVVGEQVDQFAGGPSHLQPHGS